MESILIIGPVDQQVNQRYCISICIVQVNSVRQTSQTTAHQHIVLCIASMMLTDLLCMCLCTCMIMCMCIYLYVPYEIA